MRKRLFILTTAVVVILGLIVGLSYVKSQKTLTFEGLVNVLKQEGYDTEDITDKHFQEKGYKVNTSENALKVKILDIDGEKVVLHYGDDKEQIKFFLESTVKAATNENIDFNGKPHVYNKKNEIIQYVGDNEEIISTLNKIYGKSLIE